MIQRICRSETSDGASAAPARRVAAGTIPRGPREFYAKSTSRNRVLCGKTARVTINAETAEAAQQTTKVGWVG